MLDNPAHIALNLDQQSALAGLKRFLGDPAPRTPIFAISGRAGTGNTAMLKRAVTALGPAAKVMAPTHKPVDLLKKAGFPEAQSVSSFLDVWRAPTVVRPLNALETAYYVAKGKPVPATVTTTEYIPEDGGENCSAILIDECSMVSWSDFDRIKAMRANAVYVGDGGQLPPVQGEGWFQNYPNDASLTAPQRQHAASEILTLCDEIGIGKIDGVFDLTRFRTEVKILASAPVSAITACDRVLTHANNTCDKLNLLIHRALGLVDPRAPQRPMAASKLLAWAKVGGQSGPHISKSVLYCVIVDSQPMMIAGKLVGYHCDLIDPQGRRLAGVPASDALLKHQKTGVDVGHKATIPFVYGHCVTVDKTQGDKADRVCVLLPTYVGGMTDRHRWVHTVASRARQHLFIAQGWH